MEAKKSLDILFFIFMLIITLISSPILLFLFAIAVVFSILFGTDWIYTT